MSVKVQLSPEEIAREEALFNLRNNLQATHDANVSAVKAEVSEKDRKDQEEKAKRERIITKEGEALKLSKQGRLLSFVYVVLICAIVGFAYMEYKLALNGKFSWAALTATGNIQRIVKIVFTESG